MGSTPIGHPNIRTQPVADAALARGGPGATMRHHAWPVGHGTRGDYGMARSAHRLDLGMMLVVAMLVAACGSAAPATPTAAAAGTPTTGPTATVAASPSTQPAGDATVGGPDTIEAGKKFDVPWTGPNAKGDYVTIVAAGAAKWTNEPYFYTTTGSPGSLVAPSTAGPYALWYVSGADDSILARRAIQVTPFSGALLAPDSIAAGAPFDVSWNGPNGPGDYVTIVAAGTAKWTNESYFYTAAGSPGHLVAPVTGGSYELWYVIGGDDSIQSRRPITVTALAVTLQAPAEVAAGKPFQVTWTGPNGPTDYITIVAAGSPAGSYNSYAYTAAGNPATITAPTTPGKYEIWYASDRVDNFVFGRIAVTVK